MTPENETTTDQEQEAKSIPDIRPGDTVKVYQIIPDSDSSKNGEGKEKIQVFEGVVLAKRRNREIGATITVRRVIDRIGVERIFPVFSPTIKKIEVVRRGRVKRAKLFYLRRASGRKARLKAKKFMPEISVEETPMPVENGESSTQELENENKEGGAVS
ncbi:50S ribosomal protein L19 [Patescibacteria group bacterium]|nr:50S ribosomal protein L19 [Patescibacteria group bacterium]